MERFKKWLRTPAGGEQVLDAAVLGYLVRYELEELAVDFGITYRDAARAVREALEEGC